jgi:hypothetical protein
MSLDLFLVAVLIAQVGVLVGAYARRNVFAGLFGGFVSFIAVIGIGAFV